MGEPLGKLLERTLELKHKKAKQRWFLGLVGVLFFIGVASILYPSVGNLVATLTAGTAIANYDSEVKNMPKDTISDIFKHAEKFNSDLAGGVINKEYEKCLNRNDGVMCYLEIPTINVYLPVYYGTSDEVLEKGCGYLENTSLPVGGKSTHSVISGHTGLPNAQMLTDLDRVKLGDVFYIHVLNQILAYRIDDIHSVLPDETDRLGITRGEDYVTLLTCTPYGINDKRLLVRGTRIPYSPEEKTEEIRDTDLPSGKQGLDSDVIHQIVVISIVVLVATAVFVFACLWVHNSRKNHKKNDNTEDKNG